MDWFSLILPIAYLTTLVGSLFTFSHLYRRRQALAAISLQPWFPPHTTRNIYASLLELQTTQKVPDTVLRAALLRRAVTDIHRLINLRTNKPALAQLLQRGSVGDELWQRFQVAEKEMEAELREVVEEANALSAGWGQLIFQSANEIALNEVLRRKLKEVEEKREEEKARWVERRDNVREGFMKELEGEKGTSGKGTPKEGSRRGSKVDLKVEQVPAVKAGETVQEIEQAASATTSANSTSPTKTGSSDDDVVLVEREPPAVETPRKDSTASGGGGSSKKNKKGKK